MPDRDNEVNVPEEAYEAARCELEKLLSPGPRQSVWADRIVDAAAPAIRSQERQRAKEVLEPLLGAIYEVGQIPDTDEVGAPTEIDGPALWRAVDALARGIDALNTTCEPAKRLEASKDGWAAPDEAIHAAWAAIEAMEGVPPVDRNVLAAAVSAAFLKTIGPIPALSEGPKVPASGTMCPHCHAMPGEEHTPGCLKNPKPAERSEGVGSGAGDAHPKKALLVSSLRWALGWIDKRRPRPFRGDEKPPGGLDDDWLEWAAAHDLIKDADRLPAPPPQAVQGEGSDVAGDCGCETEKGKRAQHAKDCPLGPRCDGAGFIFLKPTPDMHSDEGRGYPCPGCIDCQPEKGGGGNG